ncbi:cupin domain-containing protein [Streptomyces huiliensis]|uniref:cupin domain-containing protein n=1 Tax=Streptomyces huiliensis TaxID=2876027 RepID=UPI001CBB5B32|nr:cupin domain-containing protein [Streptomyces huiliensis]MBZ4322250.1 cupin domain-containing protein [Streptomyces huiliensis]
MTERPDERATREKVVRRADVEPITWGGEESARILLGAGDTGGLYSYYEVSVPAGQGSVYHLHHHMDECFHVTEGEFEITVGDRVHPAPAGTVVYGPRGVAHAFRNTGADTGRMLCTATPGGIEAFFEDLRDLVASDPPPQWANMRQLAAVHGIVAHAPQGAPLADDAL